MLHGVQRELQQLGHRVVGLARGLPDPVSLVGQATQRAGRSGRAAAAQPCRAHRACRPEPRRGRRPARLARRACSPRPTGACGPAPSSCATCSARCCASAGSELGRLGGPARGSTSSASGCRATSGWSAELSARQLHAVAARPARCRRAPARAGRDARRASAIRACWRAASRWCATSTARLVDSAARAREHVTLELEFHDGRVQTLRSGGRGARQAAAGRRPSRSVCSDGGAKRHRASARGHGAPARPGRRLPLGPRAGFCRASRPTPSRRPTRSPTRSSGRTSTTSRASSAICCSRWSITRRWPGRRAASTSRRSPARIADKMIRRHPHVFGSGRGG